MARAAKQRSGFDRSYILLGLIVATLVATILFIYLQLRTDRVSESVKKGEPIKVLFTVSTMDAVQLVEALLYDPSTQNWALVHVPRNVGSLIEPINRVAPISVLYDREDLSGLAQEIGGTLGTDIPYYVDVDTVALQRLVDLLEGLEMFIVSPIDTMYEGRRILLPSGSVRLDGDKVVDFILYREELEPERDIAERGWKLFQALLPRLGDHARLLNSNSASKEVRSLFRTNLAPRALRSLIAEMARLDQDGVILQRVEGALREVDGEELLFPHQEGKILRDRTAKVLEIIASREPVPVEELYISVEILNGTDINGLAARARNVYASLGFPVESIGNAEHDGYLQTIVLDRKGDLEAAWRAADIIRCKRVHTSLDAEADSNVDVTIILGRDFDGRYCKE